MVDCSASVTFQSGNLCHTMLTQKYTKSIDFCLENDCEVLQRWQRRLLFALWSPELPARSPTASFTRWQLVHLVHKGDLLFRLPLDMSLEKTRYMILSEIFCTLLLSCTHLSPPTPHSPLSSTCSTSPWPWAPLEESSWSCRTALCL